MEIEDILTTPRHLKSRYHVAVPYQIVHWANERDEIYWQLVDVKANAVLCAGVAGGVDDDEIFEHVRRVFFAFATAATDESAWDEGTDEPLDDPDWST